MRIIVFGDSIAEGMWDYKEGGWVNRLKINLWNKYGYDKLVYNYGVAAYTSNHVVKIFRNSFDALCKRDTSSEKEAIIVFAIGINDASKNEETGKNKVSLSNFSQNIESLINLCQSEELIQNVIFVGAINIDETESNRDISRWRNHEYHNYDIQRYNQVLEKLAKKTTCSYIDTFGIMNPEDFEDGLHPNAQGHEKIYNRVLEYIEK